MKPRIEVFRCQRDCSCGSSACAAYRPSSSGGPRDNPSGATWLAQAVRLFGPEPRIPRTPVTWWHRAPILQRGTVCGIGTPASAAATFANLRGDKWRAQSYQAWLQPTQHHGRCQSRRGVVRRLHVPGSCPAPERSAVPAESRALNRQAVRARGAVAHTGVWC